MSNENNNESSEDVEVVYIDENGEEMVELESLDVNFDDDENNSEDNSDIDDFDTTNLVDKSLLTFKGHKKSIFRINISHSGTLAVTGGQDDKAFVWDIQTGEILLECTGHRDSVTECSFSFDDKYVVSGDLSTLLQVWCMETKKLLWCYDGQENGADLQSLDWHHAAHVLFASCQDGQIFMWQIPQGTCKIIPTYGSNINSTVLLPNGTQLIANYVNNTIRLWDLKNVSTVQQLDLNRFLPAGSTPNNDYNDDDDELGGGDSTESSNNIILSADGKLLAICGYSVGLIVLKTADFKIIATLKDAGNDTECAVFCPNSVLVTGTLSGLLCFWDTQRFKLRHRVQLESDISFVKILCTPNDNTIYAATSNANIHIYSGQTSQHLTTLTGHRRTINDIALTTQNNAVFLLSVSDDKTSKIYDVKKCILTANDI